MRHRQKPLSQSPNETVVNTVAGDTKYTTTTGSIYYQNTRLNDHFKLHQFPPPLRLHSHNYIVQ